MQVHAAPPKVAKRAALAPPLSHAAPKAGFGSPQASKMGSGGGSWGGAPMSMLRRRKSPSAPHVRQPRRAAGWLSRASNLGAEEFRGGGADPRKIRRFVGRPQVRRPCVYAAPPQVRPRAGRSFEPQGCPNSCHLGRTCAASAPQVRPKRAGWSFQPLGCPDFPICWISPFVAMVGLSWAIPETDLRTEFMPDTAPPGRCNESVGYGFTAATSRPVLD